MVCSWPLQLSESWVKLLYLRSMLSNSMKLKVLVVHSCPTFCNPMNCSPPGSFVNRILQEKVEWGAIAFSTTAFWILAKPLHLRSMLSKSVRCTKNCSSWHWSTEQLQVFCTAMSECTLHDQCFKSWMNWAVKLCLIHCVHPTFRQPTTTSWSISTMFCRENASTTSRRQKMLSKSLMNPKAQILHYGNKPTYFLLAKMCGL